MGYSANVIHRIGDPFVRLRRGSSRTVRRRPGYEGMGLGLFIAKTLLERSGAEMSFANGRGPHDTDAGPGERTGAIVEARWRRTALAASHGGDRAALGENLPIET